MPFKKNHPESTNPAKKNKKVEEEIEDDEYLENSMNDDGEDEEQITEEIEKKETPLPTNKPEKLSDPFDLQKAELQIKRKVRELYEIERQMKTKRIRMKNEGSLDGIMSEQELLMLTEELKYQINILVAFMQQKFKVPDKWFGELFKEVEKGEKGYEYWVVESKK